MKSGNLLDTLRSNILSMFSKSKSSSKVENSLEIEIENQKNNLKEKSDIDSKYFIRKKIVYLNLKKLARASLSKYIKKAFSIIEDETDDSFYEAITYLKRVPKNLPRNSNNEIYICMALLYELVDDFKNATKEYQKALQRDVTPFTLRLYKEFVERSREIVDTPTKKSSDKVINIYNNTKLENMPDVAKRVENMAKYYARSPKSRSLGKRYFKEVLKMYKKLSQEFPKEFTCKYVSTLIEAVELFMFSPYFLKDAEEILFESNDCIDERLYLLEKINELKRKDFIKNNPIFS